jgi:hypothetical protein
MGVGWRNANVAGWEGRWGRLAVQYWTSFGRDLVGAARSTKENKRLDRDVFLLNWAVQCREIAT